MFMSQEILRSMGQGHVTQIKPKAEEEEEEEAKPKQRKARKEIAEKQLNKPNNMRVALRADTLQVVQRNFEVSSITLTTKFSLRD